MSHHLDVHDKQDISSQLAAHQFAHDEKIHATDERVEYASIEAAGDHVNEKKLVRKV